MSRVHESEGLPDVPMRVLQILDALTVERHPKNFILICHELLSVIQARHSYMSDFHMISVAVEVLHHIPELQMLESIFESTVIHTLNLNKKKRIVK